MDFLNEVKKRLDLPPADKEQVMKELESHHREVKDELIASGVHECEAEQEADRRLGDPSEIAQRMQLVHLRVGWKSALLTFLPFLLLCTERVYAAHEPTRWVEAAVGSCLGLLLCFVSARELSANRRPIWLPGFLAIGSSLLYHIPLVLVGLRLFRRSRPRIALAVLLGIPYVLVLVGVQLRIIHLDWPIYLVVGGSWLVLQYLTGITLFERHPYGRVFQVCFFLFSLTVTYDLHSAVAQSHILLFAIPWIMLTAITVVLYSRAGSSNAKINALAGGTFLLDYTLRVTSRILEHGGDVGAAIPSMIKDIGSPFWAVAVVTLPALLQDADPSPDIPERER